MSSEERRKILEMVEQGKISAEQAAHLMRALEEDAEPAQIEVIEPESVQPPARRLSSKRSRRGHVASP